MGDLGLNGRFRTGGLSHAVAVNATLFDRFSTGNSIGTTARQTSNLYAPAVLPTPALGPVPRFVPSSERSFRTVAVADTISVFDERLQVTLGARYQEIDVWNYANGARTAQIKQSKTTPTVAVLIKPAQSISLYANYAKSLAIGPVAAGGSANAGTVFSPITATSCEIGAKYQASGLLGTVALFRTNNQVGVVDPATNRFGVDGDVIVKGVEANLSGTVRPGWTIIGGMTYLATEQRGTAGGVTDSKRSVGVPDVSLSLYSALDVPRLAGLSVNGRMTYLTEQFRDAANTQFIPAWTKFDIGIKYLFGDDPTLALRLTVDNVLDRRYWQSLTRGNLARGTPRTVFVSAGMAF